MWSRNFHILQPALCDKNCNYLSIDGRVLTTFANEYKMLYK